VCAGIIAIIALCAACTFAAVAQAAPSRAEEEALPRPTHGSQLKVYFGGDSMAYDPGAPFAQMAAATGVMRMKVDSASSSRIVTDFQTT
jgi:hypothetical protein